MDLLYLLLGLGFFAASYGFVVFAGSLLERDQ